MLSLESASLDFSVLTGQCWGRQNALRASVRSVAQQRILGRVFRLRCWSGTSMSSIGVSSALNLANPLSKETCFQSGRQAVAEAYVARRGHKQLVSGTTDWRK